MASKQFNSVDGYSVGNATIVINNNGNVIANASITRNSRNVPTHVFQSNTAPTNALVGDQWYNTFNGILFEYLDDGTTLQWVDIGSLPYPNVAAGNASAVQTNLATTGTVFTPFISATANGNYSLISNTNYSANLANGSFNASLLGGTLTTAAQPNITSVGTLTSLAVTGNITSGNFVGRLANGNSNVNIATANGNVTIAAVGNTTLTITGTGANISGTLNATGNANVGNIGATRGVFTNIAGEGGNISNIQGANVSGAVASATSATTAGTVTTAAQPNITSVGTLTSLSVTGNIIAGNVSAGATLSGTTLSVTNAIITTGNITTINSGLLQNGNSNVTITANGNVTISAVGGARITATSAGANVAGTLGVSGNANVGNIGAGIGVFTGNVNAPVFRGSNGTANTVTAVLTYGADNNFQFTTQNGSATNASGQEVARAGINYAGSGWDSFTQYVRGGGANTGWQILYAANTAIANITSAGVAITGALTTNNITTGANTTAGTVTGNWTLTAGSRWQSTYADLAERYVADDTYEPGTVVVLGGEKEVTIENVADSHKVAGVITTNPAYIMNAELSGDNVVEVALIGRVPCKVVGPVNKGDLLTTAEIAGYAHANNNAYAGRIIGKSLENFNGDTGIIEIMVGKT